MGNKRNFILNIAVTGCSKHCDNGNLQFVEIG